MTSKIRLLYFCAICLSGVAAFGCASLIFGPRPEPPKFYVLTPASAAPAPPSSPGSSGGLTLGLGPVKLPAYLDRNEVVIRAAENRLEFSKNDRWGESLEKNFARVLARDLAAHLGTQQIVVFPWYATTLIDLQVQVEVYRFETDVQGSAQLSAKWTIRNGDGSKILYTAESNFSQPSKPGDTTEAVAALSRDTGDLSREIANMVQQVRLQQPQPPSRPQ
ncbi:MAG: PqiC family protein [Candidatus Binatus sp.]|uniref:PqiC family protein n=1 Tax=Candidatus Binatus sp. TaxID=2811406 RepID=UPI002727E987|nr:PqiC family protein [Candidatus Binatus sp.]MDO8430950.1 PqiC family protein [Candidatus Binatus sp.]